MEAVKVRGAVPDEKKMGREAVARTSCAVKPRSCCLPARKKKPCSLTSLRYRWALEV